MSFSARNLRYEIDGRVLLDDVSLSLEPGRVHAVLGPNGAGKSTLLRLLAGEWTTAQGRVELNKRDLHEWTPPQRARQRAVLPQGESLRFGFRVEQVVALGRLPCIHQGVVRETAIVNDALATAGAAHLAPRQYPTLSGGERARVQFARVLVQIWEPVELGERYLLLDEPTASLDLAHQHSLLAAARRFAAQGVGVLTILHDPNLALAYADEVTLIHQGRVLAQDSASACLTAANLSALYGVAVERLGTADGRSWLVVRP